MGRGYAPRGAEIDDDTGGHEGLGYGHGAAPNVREFEHRGHRVRIITHYDVTIDDEPCTRPMQVLADGNVTSHDPRSTYLRRLEEAIQTVSGDDAFALPYWDWSQDAVTACGWFRGDLGAAEPDPRSHHASAQ